MTAPIRILFPFVGGDVVGGSHQSALRLIRGLDRAQFAPVIVLHGGEGKLAEQIKASGLSYQRLDWPGIIAPRYSRSASDVSLPRYVLQSIPALARLLRQQKIDIVHTNDGRMHGSWALPTRLAGRKFIWHHRQAPDAFGVNKIAPLLANHIISVSHFSCPSRPLRSVEGRISVIRSPFDLPETRPDRGEAAAALRERLGIAANAVVVGYIGTLNLRKRPMHFIAALHALREALPDRPVHGAICGTTERDDEPILDELRNVIDHYGMSEQVHLMGQVNPIESVMAGLDALWITALDEPFGRTLIEAMHLRTPLVATRHGGNPEAIRDGETGYLVDPADPAAFVAPTLSILNNPLNARCLTSSAAAELSQYCAREHIRRVQALYQDLAHS